MSEKTREVTAHGDANGQIQSDQGFPDGNGHASSSTKGSSPADSVTSGFEDSDVDPIVVETTGEKKRKRKKILYIGAAALFVLIIAGIAYWLYARQYESTDDAFVDADVTQVSPKVSAYVKKIYVDNNQMVHKGDLLVELDPSDLQVRLQQAQAQLENARSQRDVAEANAHLTTRTTAASQQTAQSNLQSARQNVEQQRLASQARQAQITQAQAAANTSEATLRQAQAQVPGARANVQLAQVEYNRRLVLFNRGDISRQNLDQAMNAFQTAQAQLNAAEKAVKQLSRGLTRPRQTSAPPRKLTASRSPRSISHSRRSANRRGGFRTPTPHRNVSRSANHRSTTAEAGDPGRGGGRRDRPSSNLHIQRSIAPEDGYVTRKNVEEGQLVQVGAPLMAISQSDEIWVVANFKETQLENMQIGQPVDIKVDAFPSESFHGKVESLQAGTGSRFSVLPAENATGNYVKVVQRVPVKIVFDEPPDKIKRLVPGMSVEPR